MQNNYFFSHKDHFILYSLGIKNTCELQNDLESLSIKELTRDIQSLWSRFFYEFGLVYEND